MKFRLKEQYENQWNIDLVIWKDKHDRQTIGQTNQKREKTQINTARGGDMITNTNEIHRTIREYFQNV
jgi:hypothetical protein